MLKLKFSMFFAWVGYLVSIQVCAVTLNNLRVMNNSNKSIIMLDFQESASDYKFYILHHPERLVLDIFYIDPPVYHEKFPVNFSYGNIINRISVRDLSEENIIRFIFDLSYISSIDDILLENINGYYTVLLIITRYISCFSNIESCNLGKDTEHVLNSCVKVCKLKNHKNSFLNISDNKFSKHVVSSQMKMFTVPIIVAIDAGHGGHDPGAMGYSGIYEKDITISIARKLKKLLDTDSVFDPVMIREGDYFISVFERSELARNKGAKILLSIHANAISNSAKNNIRGASVWVLSDYRANIEMSHWLKNSHRWSQLLGGVSEILVSSINSDPYFNRMILDLQFSHSQRVGYDIASHILRELKNIGVLYKYVPEYSNFGILRSLDIPSVLIETGFITHAREEKLLVSDHYQQKIADALYQGLRAYFNEYCFSYVEKKVKYNKSFYNIKSVSGNIL